MRLPSDIYNEQVKQKNIQLDPLQRSIITILDRISLELHTRQKIRNSTMGKIRRSIKPRPPITGLYLWGSVGIGKTFMMDLFYDNLLHYLLK